MSKEYSNNNRFGLWLNKDRKEETHPNITGQGETNHKNHWISAWFSKDLSDEDKATLAEIVKRHSINSKKPFISISIKEKVSGVKEAHQAINNAPVDDYNDNDIPF